MFGSEFEFRFGGFTPQRRRSPWDFPEAVVGEFLLDVEGFSKSVFHAQENQPEGYDPSRPTWGAVLPVLFEAVQEALPSKLGSYLRCYQGIDTYLDFFHHTDYLFVLGGFSGKRDAFMRVDVTTNPETLKKRKPVPTSPELNLLLVGPKDVFIHETEDLNTRWIRQMGIYIARILLLQYYKRG